MALLFAGIGKALEGAQEDGRAQPKLRASDLGPRVAVRLLWSGRIGREGVWPSGGQ